METKFLFIVLFPMFSVTFSLAATKEFPTALVANLFASRQHYKTDRVDVGIRSSPPKKLKEQIASI